ncbi:tetratricopeptide repeat protein [Lujinxingia sediminis]|uniref:Tetratricopeptide repeat protein n=1 Tax=Lujinxingia sediminis TaxID=2480984 RepID=A0ABY0CN56_9DELT|nr:tetratricopeptide repeat protein [Lujinxingia sediminis]
MLSHRRGFATQLRGALDAADMASTLAHGVVAREQDSVSQRHDETPSRLGPFELGELVGTGGMGQVWQARHVGEGRAVAIKVMRRAQLDAQRFREAFQREVRAVARLNHPGVVRVFDSGEVPAGLERSSGGRLVEGCAYLAMDLAVGTLERTDLSQWGWERRRAILIALLDALAHAHARGVIHRDLKPANVLWVPDAAGDPRLKLSDFGLAFALHDEALLRRGVRERRVAGTPRFMAPEQITGRWRDQGPWTDLYALGCLAYWLLGQPAFGGARTEDVLRDQLQKPHPRLTPVVEVPEGLQGWLDGLLAKNPAGRYQRAADAAHDLRQLRLAAPASQEASASNDAGSTSFYAAEEGASREVITLALPAEGEPTVSRERMRGGGGLGLKGEAKGEEMAARRACDLGPAPPPRTWQKPRNEESDGQLLGVGLGLFGLRSLPLVGRQGEREQLWQALLDVYQTGRPRLALVRGDVGVGASRLVQWLAERAHETGAAEVLQASHSPTGGPSDGVARMMGNVLRCTGLSRDEIALRVGQLFEDQAAPGLMARHLDTASSRDQAELVELLSPGCDPDVRDDAFALRLVRPSERHMTWRRLLERLTARRPALLVLHDVQWGSATLSFVRHLLNEQAHGGLPVLIVATLREGEEARARPVGEQLRDLLRFERAWQLGLAPLARTDHERLIEEMLGLERGLAEQVAERTAGNPLFALQLVGDWVERGVLEVGPRGFELRAGTTSDLPDDIHQVLRQRVDELVGVAAIAAHQLEGPAGRFGGSERARRALELAAALGRDVEERQWRRACELAECVSPPVLPGLLEVRHLIERHPTGWSFMHGALRETLEKMAREAGRWQSHHRVAAAMLEEFGAHPGASAARRGYHLLEAGLPEAALEPLWQGARLAVDTFALHEGVKIAERFECALRTAGIGANDPRWAESYMLRALAHLRPGELDAAAGALEQARIFVETLEASHHPDASLQRAEHTYLLGVFAQLTGDPTRGYELAERASATFDAVGHADGLARALYLQAESMCWLGDDHQALPMYRRAEAIFASLDDVRGVAKSKMGVGNLEMRHGDFDRGQALIEEALTVFQEQGDTYATAMCYSNLGEGLRARGMLAGALEICEQGVEMMRRAGLFEASIELNLCCAALAMGDVDRAARALKALQPRVIDMGSEGLLGVIYACWLPIYASRGQWKRWARSAEKARTHLERQPIHDGDLAWTFELAAAMARRAGRLTEARQALRSAIAQHRALGASEALERAEALLITLSDSRV